jgi:regulator of protease activity HflC (stomatin/prohibitin superfamily)
MSLAKPIMKWIGIVLGAVLVFALLLMLGLPVYSVWQQEKAGQARLAEAESSRRIAVREAEAKRDAAKALSEAEIERARGVAAANKIIGDSLQGNESYLRYLWIQNLSAGDGREVVYIPTETGLPILEASRLGATK